MNSASNPNKAIQFENEQYLIANQLRFAYEEFGNVDNPVILLIMGLGTQMIAWPDTFCEDLASRGYRVIRFDNRDIGLSEKIKLKKSLSIPKLLLKSRFGMKFDVPYTLHDMATDTAALLDTLEIKNAHIVGASMGGMIAQLIAAQYPSHCRSLTSIMSTTGNRALPTTNLKVTRQLINRPKSGTEAARVAYSMKTHRMIGSPDFPAEEEDLRTRIQRTIRRSYYPTGYLNQLAAIMHNGDRRHLLKTITTPTLVIHGKADILVPVEGGIDTAKNINGAELKLIEGMGHDLPKQLLPKLARMISQHVKKVDSI